MAAAAAEQVLLVAVYYRTNLTMPRLAPLFGVSPATVCRGIQRLGPLLALEPARAFAEAAEGLRIIDGTLVPVRDRKVGVPSRNYRFSANVQVVVDAETRLVVAGARQRSGRESLAGLRPGRTLRRCDRPRRRRLHQHQPDRPHRKHPGRPLLKGEEEDNAQHRMVRARVEHTLSPMKNYKILRDRRQRGDGLHHAVQAVTRMHNLALTA
ncbi:transposase family protein [Streptomyces sp. NPDC054844]